MGGVSMTLSDFERDEDFMSLFQLNGSTQRPCYNPELSAGEIDKLKSFIRLGIDAFWFDDNRYTAAVDMLSSVLPKNGSHIRFSLLAASGKTEQALEFFDEEFCA